MPSLAHIFSRRACSFVLGAGAFVLSAGIVVAQTVDSLKIKPVPVASPDSVKNVQANPKLPGPRTTAVAALRAPPITPRRAFLYSLMVPGWGQSRLDRGTAGALFASLELGSIAMVGKTTVDLKQAQRYSVDSLPATYTIDSNGKIIGVGTFAPQLPVALVSTRRLHREDWFAVLMFNHLISGADAFVAAQLWDVPTSFAVKPYADGVMFVATVHW
ncbi:MAG: hypothetical protein ABJB74_07315 [Gemmatimonas sp.]